VTGPRAAGSLSREYRGGVGLSHLGLPVRDLQRSRRFYETHFGFDAGPATECDDGVLIIRNAEGFDLALAPAGEPGPLPPFLHFGFRLPGPEEVAGLRARLVAAGVAIREDEDQPGFRSFKCLDPDGYVVEAYWQAPSIP
jgi:catechol 2,3-dioxygenase-like lactoylglutathione lyase family enzyme